MHTGFLKSLITESWKVSKMGRLNQLTGYFEDIASRNVDLKHTKTECHFTKRTLEDILLDMRGSDLFYPLLNLEPYDFDFTDSESDNVHKNNHLAFSIIKTVEDATNASLKFEAWDICEEIGDEILIKILGDKRKRQPPLSGFLIAESKGIPFENKGDKLVGFRYEITLSCTRCNDINPEKWQ